MRFDEDAKLVEKASSTNEGKLRLDVGNIAKFGSKLGYEVSKIETRGNEIEIKRYVATTCSHANRTSSCSVLAFLSGRAARS